MGNVDFNQNLFCLSLAILYTLIIVPGTQIKKGIKNDHAQIKEQHSQGA